MEVLMGSIERFLGSGFGDGSGFSSGYGDGSGDGSGFGFGDGDGSGSGSGSGIKSYNNKPVYYIDGIPTIIEKIHNNLAKGFIIAKDLILHPVYVVKNGSLFAHGATIKEAESALSDKIFETMDVDSKIDAFINKFNLVDKYPAKVFYDWHHKLTGSCEFGRNAFVKNNGIDLENGMYTVAEFIEITENDYGGSIIKQLKERITK